LKLPPLSILAFIALGLAPGLSLAVSPALAGEVQAPELTDAQRALLEQNPALADLAANTPELAQQAFELIARAAADPSPEQRGFEGVDADDALLLGQNPALLQAWRSSPEASADLLALIKSAAGGKPQK